MSWYNIHYACGHEGHEQIYGPCGDRENKAAWLGNNRVCKPCWIKGRAEADRKQAMIAAGLITK